MVFDRPYVILEWTNSLYQIHCPFQPKQSAIVCQLIQAPVFTSARRLVTTTYEYIMPKLRWCVTVEKLLHNRSIDRFFRCERVDNMIYCVLQLGCFRAVLRYYRKLAADDGHPIVSNTCLTRLASRPTLT